MVMTFLLLALMILTETGFMILAGKDISKGNLSFKRMMVNAGQLVLFLASVLLPGIDLSFRFAGLLILLGIRIIFAVIFYLINRKKVQKKKSAGKIFSLIMSVLLIAGSLLPAFVFTDYKGLPVSGLYSVKMSKAILIDKNRIEKFEDDGSYREVPAYFFAPEDAPAGSRFPLIVFSHGAFGYYESNASTYLELASHGYVVVSIEHPYHSFFTQDTDGKTVIVDSGFMNSVMNADQTEEEIFAASQEWMSLRVADMDFAVNELIKGADNDIENYWFSDEDSRADVLNALSELDSDKIGLMGHSMGGATSVEVANQRDDIDAVIDIDGTMLGSITGASGDRYVVEDIEYKVPVFEIENMNAHEEALEAERIDYPYPNNMIRKNADVYFSTYFEGSLHMDFTDLPLFSPFLAKMLGSGDVDNEYVMSTVNSLALDFFDCYLKGNGQFSCEDSYPGVRK